MTKVSIVVPIYNVENYLEKCLESIINQTYKNLEIILVDDGSTDKSNNIAKKYVSLDSRIKLFNKKNGGLSDARNYGMKYITGEYVLFIDSDDWLDENMILHMVNKSIQYKADIVQLGFYYAYEDHLLYDNRYYDEKDSDVILNNKELMKELIINEKVKNFAWGKLYKTEIIKNIFFKKGVLFEDVFWAHHVMSKVEKYVILHQPMFYYRQRNNSISGTYNVKNTDIIKGLLERHEFIKQNYNHLEKESYKIIFKTSLQHYDLLKKNKAKDGANFQLYTIKKYIIENYENLYESIKEDKDLKNQLKYFKINPNINNLYIFKNKVLRKLKLKKQESKLKRIEIHETSCSEG